jgi:hypothetical protein
MKSCPHCADLQKELDAARGDLRARDAFIREIREARISSKEALDERDAALARAEQEIAKLKAFRFDIWFARGVSRVGRRIARRR